MSQRKNMVLWVCIKKEPHLEWSVKKCFYGRTNKSKSKRLVKFKYLAKYMKYMYMCVERNFQKKKEYVKKFLTWRNLRNNYFYIWIGQCRYRQWYKKVLEKHRMALRGIWGFEAGLWDDHIHTATDHSACCSKGQ